MEIKETDNISELWLAGASLDHAYPTPSADQLVAHWSETHDQTNVLEAPGVFGAIRIPNEQPEIIASIDLCEVIRKTVHSMMDVFGKTPEQIENFSFYETNFGINTDTVTGVIQTLMNHGYLEPVDGIDEIKNIIKSWRQIGVYCIANTSTLPGCEIPTINFLDEWLPGCFDGIVLPRNHDGKGAIKKGHAIEYIIDEYADIDNVTVLHIDDAGHHCAGVKEIIGARIGQDRVTTIMPLYPGADIPDGSLTASTPLGAFVIANDIIQAAP